MKRTSAPAVILIALVVLFPILYLLSTGPAVLLHSRGVIDLDNDNGPWTWVYGPVGQLCDRSDHFRLAIGWYLHFWDPVTYSDY